MTPAMALALTASFGAVSEWAASLRALCAGTPEALGGGASTVYRPQEGRLLNVVVPQAGDFAILSCTADYASALVDRMDWAAAYAQYQHVIREASRDLAVELAVAADAMDAAPSVRAQVIDVRRDAAYQQATHIVAGARWHDPAAVATWLDRVSPNCPVIVYCVHGHDVSQAVALRLRAAGLTAHYLRGGIDTWQAAGRPVSVKSARD